MAIVVRFLYVTHIRQAWNSLCQWALERNEPRAKIPKFNTPDEVAQLLTDFQWREDPVRGMIDYFSDPEVFYARLLDKNIRDEDCDGIARFFAYTILHMSSVTKVYILHTWFQGGAHATVVYKYLGHWYHYNYAIEPILVPMEAVYRVTKMYSTDHTPHFWDFEDYLMYPVAIAPSVI